MAEAVEIMGPGLGSHGWPLLEHAPWQISRFQNPLIKKPDFLIRLIHNLAEYDTHFTTSQTANCR